MAVQVLARIREELQKNLPLSSIFKAQTVTEMARLLGGSEQVASPYLVPIQETGTRLPLFCFHPAGGGVLMYRTLAISLAKDQPVYGLQSRSVEGAMPEHTSIEAMAREYAVAIRTQQPEGPYYLLGWSMGGIIAVAVASELEHAGQKVAFVGLLDSYLASSEEDLMMQEGDPLDGLELVIEVAITRAPVVLSQDEKEKLWKSLPDLPEQDRFIQALKWGKEHKVLPESLSLEVLRSQVMLATTHRTLMNRYSAPSIQAPLIVWWASESMMNQSRTMWDRYTSGSVQERTVNGDHFAVIRPPSIQEVAQDMECFLLNP